MVEGKTGKEKAVSIAGYRLEPSCVLQDCNDRRAEGAETEEAPSLALPLKTVS